MKIQNILLFIGAICSLFACTEDYNSPYPVSDVAWYTSKPTLKTYAISQYEMMGFIDASQGELLHEWVIEDGSYFLNNEFGKGDSLALFIDHEKGLRSVEDGVNIYFETAGRKSVTLLNTFADSVSYNGETALYAKPQNDGTWLVDTTFIVDVYGDINTAYKVCRVVEEADGTLIAGEVLVEVGPEDNPLLTESETWESVSVEVGERLMFIDLTEEADKRLVQPNERLWSIKNTASVSTYSDSIAIVYFNVYGFKATGLGSIKSSRTVVDIPSATTQKVIPLKLEVVQSSQKFTYADGAMWISPTSIAFNVSGEVSKLGTTPEDNFTVHITNANKSLDKNIDVTKVSYDAQNASILSLQLAEEIYADDVITVSFDATGADIQSMDERTFESFSAKTVAVPMGSENLLADKKDWAGFEGGGADAAINTGKCGANYWVGAQDATNPTWVRVEEKFNEGSASMKYNGDINGPKSLYGMNFGSSVDITAGAYEVSHRIYIEAGSTIKVLKTDIGRKSNSWAIDVTMLWDVESLPRGEWVTIKQLVNFPVAYNSDDKTRYSYYVKGALNDGVTGNQTFYLDDMGLVKVEAGKRP